MAQANPTFPPLRNPYNNSCTPLNTQFPPDSSPSNRPETGAAARHFSPNQQSSQYQSPFRQQLSTLPETSQASRHFSPYQPPTKTTAQNQPSFNHQQSTRFESSAPIRNFSPYTPPAQTTTQNQSPFSQQQRIRPEISTARRHFSPYQPPSETTIQYQSAFDHQQRPRFATGVPTRHFSPYQPRVQATTQNHSVFSHPQSTQPGSIATTTRHLSPNQPLAQTTTQNKPDLVQQQNVTSKEGSSGVKGHSLTPMTQSKTTLAASFKASPIAPPKATPVPQLKATPPKVTPLTPSKVTPVIQPKATLLAPSKTTPVIQPKVTPLAPPKAISVIQPKTTPLAPSKTIPVIQPKVIPLAPPKAIPLVPSKMTSVIQPKVTPLAPSKTTPVIQPKVTPLEPPKATPLAPSKMTSVIQPKVTPLAPLKTTPVVRNKATPLATPKGTQEPQLFAEAIQQLGDKALLSQVKPAETSSTKLAENEISRIETIDHESTTQGNQERELKKQLSMAEFKKTRLEEAFARREAMVRIAESRQACEKNHVQARPEKLSKDFSPHFAALSNLGPIKIMLSPKGYLSLFASIANQLLGPFRSPQELEYSTTELHRRAVNYIRSHKAQFFHQVKNFYSRVERNHKLSDEIAFQCGCVTLFDTNQSSFDGHRILLLAIATLFSTPICIYEELSQSLDGMKLGEKPMVVFPVHTVTQVPVNVIKVIFASGGSHYDSLIFQDPQRPITGCHAANEKSQDSPIPETVM